MAHLPISVDVEKQSRIFKEQKRALFARYPPIRIFDRNCQTKLFSYLYSKFIKGELWITEIRHQHLSPHD